MSVHQGTHTHAYAHTHHSILLLVLMRMKGGVGLLHATEVCCGQPASSLLCRLGLWTQGQSIIVVFTSWPDLSLQPATEELSLDTVPIHSHDTLREHLTPHLICSAPLLYLDVHFCTGPSRHANTAAKIREGFHLF